MRKLSFVYTLCVSCHASNAKRHFWRADKVFNNRTLLVQGCCKVIWESGTNTWVFPLRGMRALFYIPKSFALTCFQTGEASKRGWMGFSHFWGDHRQGWGTRFWKHLRSREHSAQREPLEIELQEVSMWSFSTFSYRGTQIPTIRMILLAANHCQYC